MKRLNHKLIVLSIFTAGFAIMLLGAAFNFSPAWQRSWLTTNASSGTFLNGNVPTWNTATKRWNPGSGGSGTNFSGIWVTNGINLGIDPSASYSIPLVAGGSMAVENWIASQLDEIDQAVVALFGQGSRLPAIGGNGVGLFAYDPGSAGIGNIATWNESLVGYSYGQGAMEVNGPFGPGFGITDTDFTVDVRPSTDNSRLLGNQNFRWGQFHVMQLSNYGSASLGGGILQADLPGLRVFIDSLTAFQIKKNPNLNFVWGCTNAVTGEGDWVQKAYIRTNTAPFLVTKGTLLSVTNINARGQCFVQLAFDDVTGGIPSCTVVATNLLNTNNFGIISPTLSGLTLVGTVTITNHYTYPMDTNMILKVTDTSSGGAAVRMIQSILFN